MLLDYQGARSIECRIIEILKCTLGKPFRTAMASHVDSKMGSRVSACCRLKKFFAHKDFFNIGSRGSRVFNSISTFIIICSLCLLGTIYKLFRLRSLNCCYFCYLVAKKLYACRLFHAAVMNNDATRLLLKPEFMTISAVTSIRIVF